MSPVTTDPESIGLYPRILESQGVQEIEMTMSDAVTLTFVENHGWDSIDNSDQEGELDYRVFDTVDEALRWAESKKSRRILITDIETGHEWECAGPCIPDAMKSELRERYGP